MRRRCNNFLVTTSTSFLLLLLLISQGTRAADTSSKRYAKLSYDKLVALGGTVTFTAEIFEENGERPKGEFVYTWRDNIKEYGHNFVSETTENTTSSYRVSYPAPRYHLGVYEMQVHVCKWEYMGFFCGSFVDGAILFPILFNGNLTAHQTNYTGKDGFISASKETQLSVNVNKKDYDYIVKKSASIVTHWFIDCQYFNRTNGFTLNYNFTKPNTTYLVEALVVANLDQPTTTVAPTTTSTTISPVPPNGTIPNSANVTSTIPSTTTTTTTPSTTTAAVSTNSSVPHFINETYPLVCSSNLLPDLNVTYGHFKTEIHVKAPISKLDISGSTWIQPWNNIQLEITCSGTGPFQKCIEIHFGKYNATGNETCTSDNSETLDVCKFSFSHYFLDALEYTVLIILSNDVGTEIHPVGVNIYKHIPKPQLSVIVVPLSCSLVAVVLIVFGIAYYVQNKSRFTVEVADFDFGQRSADMEYKTFGERLRDSFNNAGYKQLHTTKDLQ